MFCRCDECLNQHDGTGAHCCLSLVLLGTCAIQRRGHGEGVIRERRAASFPGKRREDLDNGKCHQEPGFSDHCSRSHRGFLGHEGIFFLSVKIIFCLFYPGVTLLRCKISEKSMHQNKTTKPTTFSRLLLSILVGWK